MKRRNKLGDIFFFFFFDAFYPNIKHRNYIIQTYNVISYKMNELVTTTLVKKKKMKLCQPHRSLSLLHPITITNSSLPSNLIFVVITFLNLPNVDPSHEDTLTWSCPFKKFKLFFYF